MSHGSALASSLAVILPSHEDTQLLRAALLDEEASREAWRAWQRLVGDVKAAMSDDRRPVKRLLPLLFASLRRSGAEIDAALLPYLRLAYMREQMRSATYLRICADVLETLERDAV